MILVLFLFPTMQSAAAETPRRGGTLRLARTTDPSSLDPCRIYMSDDFMLMTLLHQPLLWVVNVTNLVPAAASEWSMSPDARVFTFQLRPGVRFSNGREVEARDYVFALERALSPGTGSILFDYLQGIRGASAFASGKAKQVAGLKTPARDQLVIELEQPDPTFAYLMVWSAGMALPEEEVLQRGARFSMAPVGSGPYQIEEWRRGARLRLKPNPYYAGPEPRHLDGVDIFIGGDGATHQMMFERGELDLLVDLPFASYRQFSGDARWSNRIEVTERFQVWFLCMNQELPPFDNVLVRRAMNHAINRDRWMRVDQRQAAHAEGIIPRISPAFDPGFRGYDYNPDKARKLLRESGLPLPLRTVFWHGSSDSGRFISQGVQGDLRAVGIEAELKQVDGSQLARAAATRGRVPLHLTGWGSFAPDVLEIIAGTLTSRSLTNDFVTNMAFYRNPQVDQWTREAAGEVDLARRIELTRRLERLIVEDAPWVFMGFGVSIGLRQPWVKGGRFGDFRLDEVWLEDPRR